MYSYLVTFLYVVNIIKRDIIELKQLQRDSREFKLKHKVASKSLSLHLTHFDKKEIYIKANTDRQHQSTFYIID